MWKGKDLRGVQHKLKRQLLCLHKSYHIKYADVYTDKQVFKYRLPTPNGMFIVCETNIFYYTSCTV